MSDATVATADTTPTTRRLCIELSAEEAATAAMLFDIAVKAAGLQVAGAALVLIEKIRSAAAAADAGSI